VPKRRIKEDKPRKKMGKKQILIPPIIVGIATLSGFLIMHFFPAPSPVHVCLKAHNKDTFNVHSRIDLEVNGQKKLLPDTLGKQKDGKDCLRVIHADSIGDTVHIQFVRPVRLTLDDFMKIYSNNNTIQVIDNSTGKNKYENISLANYTINYSYFSDNRFVRISNLTTSPPLSDNFLGRISLVSK